MMHAEIYLNKYVVSIAPFSTPACPNCSQNIAQTLKIALFACFRFLIFHPFPGGSAGPICPCVRTPMRRSNDQTPTTGTTNRKQIEVMEFEHNKQHRTLLMRP